MVVTEQRKAMAQEFMDAIKERETVAIKNLFEKVKDQSCKELGLDPSLYDAVLKENN